ncbi:MAG: translation initiation factor IF-2 associated domain-containing protein, partial [Luminiphilus sp.]
MAQTVAELAETVGASVDRLLAQMKDAGLPHAAAEEEVSEDDKQTLLAFLKKSHGESSSAPRKITLKRKQLSTLRTGGSGKRTVNVEVRKKRTYVKRDDLEEAAPGAEASELPATDVANAEAGLDAGPAAGEGLEVEAAASAVAAGVADPGGDAAADSLPPEEESGDVDPEVLRQRAAARRKVEEEQRQKALAAAAEERRQEEQRKLEAAQARQADAGRKASSPGDTEDRKPKRLHEAPAARAPRDDAERKRPGRARLDRSSIPGARGKQRGHNLSLSDIEAAEAGVGRRRGSRRKKAHEEHTKHGFEQPTEKITYEVNLPENISVGELSQQMAVKAGVVIKEL